VAPVPNGGGGLFVFFLLGGGQVLKLQIVLATELNMSKQGTVKNQQT
jgi:hypothetical protein